MKTRATGYTDFFKGKSTTPDEEEDKITKPGQPQSMVEKRKEALKRRLQRARAGK